MIIDTPPGDRAVVIAAMRACDLLILPVGPSMLDRARVEATLELLEEAAAARPDGEPPELRLLLTRTRAGTRSRVEVREHFDQQRLMLFDSEIPVREQIARSGGMPIDELGPYGALADEIRALRAVCAHEEAVV